MAFIFEIDRGRWWCCECRGESEGYVNRLLGNFDRLQVEFIWSW